jgi:hypothetical protein
VKASLGVTFSSVYALVVEYTPDEAAENVPDPKDLIHGGAVLVEVAYPVELKKDCQSTAWRP